MKLFRLTLFSLEQTERFGVGLAGFFDEGDVVFLSGPLGAGKTTLTQFIAKGLMINNDCYITSPTYNLLHIYNGRIPIYHLDFYRLNDEEDIEEAGLLDYIGARGVTIIEWPDRLGNLTPEDRMEIIIQPEENHRRTLTIDIFGRSWENRASQMINYFTSTCHLSHT